jgi:nucleotidyltransferase/DNA polymerase involved in DNA repair
MPPTLAALLLPDLPVQLEQQRRGLELPLLIPHPVDSGVIFARSREAAAAGVQIGMSLYQAQQMFPLGRVVDPDEHAYHACHSAVQAALQAYTPLIETVTLGEFLIDVRGIAKQASGTPAAGEQTRLVSLAAELGAAAQAASGLEVRVGLAAGKFTASQAARQAAGSGVGHSELVVPPGEEARFLAPLPIDVLPNLPGEMRRRLHLLDLHTLGDLAALRKVAVLRQFGGEISSLYELARGHDPRPLNPDVPPLRLVRSLRLTSPVEQRQPLLNAIQRLCWQLSKTLNHKGYHAEALKLTLYAADGTRSELGQAAKPPTSDEARLSRLAAVLLGRLPVAAPVAVVAVSVYPLRSWHLGLQQVALAQAGVPARQVRFEETLQLLIHRFGAAVVRVASLLGPPVPVRVEVTLDRAGLPGRLEVGGQAFFLEVVDQWREEQSWWDRPLRRDYFRVTMPDGSPRKIFQNLVTGDWYLDRSWPLL